MSKIERFEHDSARRFRDFLTRMLEPIAAQFGLAMKIERGAYSASDYTLTFKFTILDELGKPTNFEDKARSVGLPEDCWNQTFTSPSSKRYRIVDINLRNRKYKLIAEGVVDGKRWKIPVRWATHEHADLG